MSRINSIGVTRSLCSKYVDFKRNYNYHNQSKRSCLNDSGNPINETGKMNLILITKENLIEMSNWHLPPKYVEIFDTTNDILKELLIKFAKLQEDQQKRIMPKFDDLQNKKIDKLIRLNIREMTDRIKECEENIKKMSYEKIETEKESLVRNNMKQNLLYKLTDFTKKLKINEEEYVKKYKELVGEELKYNADYSTNFNSNFNSNYKSNFDPKQKIENFLKIDSSNDVLAKRDDEINNLVNSISELASIFKDFQILVLEQGTILDRIDYNIDVSLSNVSEAVVQLKKANKNMEANCARNTNLTLITLIFILSILILFKYT